MTKKKVLLAGESWVSTATHIKGFDQFPTVTYHTGADELLKALKDSPSAQAVQERHDAWASDIPKDDDALWDWLAGLDDASRMALLAHCVSYGVNALYERPNPHSAGGVSQHTLDMRLAQADRLTHATGLDMVEAGWRPTFGNYLNRVTKPRILQAVREGAGESVSVR